MFRRALLASALSFAFVSAGLAATVEYNARLSGQREIPKTDSKGSGHMAGTYDTTTKVLNYTLTFNGLSGPATAAHLHGPATRTQSAGVMNPLGDKNPSSPVTGSATLSDDQAQALQSGKVYVNVHTAANPGGEIRGQLTHSGHGKRAGKKAKATTNS